VDTPSAGIEVAPGQIVEVGLAWGGRAGKVVGTFAIEVLRSHTDGANTVLVSRAVGFRSCWFRTVGSAGGTDYQSPLFDKLEELPADLAAEVTSLLSSEIVIHPDVARYGLVQYINCPGHAV
jgi:hypothetical protein